MKLNVLNLQIATLKHKLRREREWTVEHFPGVREHHVPLRVPSFRRGRIRAFGAAGVRGEEGYGQKIPKSR